MPTRDLDRKRERERRYREANREKLRKYHREYKRSWDKANREKTRSYQRRHDLKRRHGLDAAALAAMWQAQGERCYLCIQPLALSQVVIDHDHACCPPKFSCTYCRRGLACNRCNSLIGYVDEDMNLLRVIAGNLDRVSAATRHRTAAKPQQTELEATR
jgi:hypothetical protein